jgi:hypothetical protein
MRTYRALLLFAIAYNYYSFALVGCGVLYVCGVRCCTEKNLQKMEYFIKETTWLNRNHSDFGWGNGYVLLPPSHEFHGRDYDFIDVSVHGGLTFSREVTEEMVNNWPELNEKHIGMWCVGFDTAHYSDNLIKWPREAVEAETKALYEQLKRLTP